MVFIYLFKKIINIIPPGDKILVILKLFISVTGVSILNK